MKLLTPLRICLLSIVSASALMLSAATELPAEPEYADQMSLMKDFVDTSKHPEKPITWWAERLAQLVANEPNLQDFRRQIMPTAKIADVQTRTKKIKELFIANQQKFKENLKKYLLANLMKFKTAVEKRAAKS